MGPTIFIKLREQLGEALAREEINRDFLMACEEGIIEFSRLKEESKRYQEIIVSLKLFSATHSGEVILRNCISQLKDAKGREENPTTLGELSGLIDEVCDLGEEIRVAMEQRDVNSRLRSIRKRTFRVQEEAEEINLIENIDARLDKIPAKIRKTFIGHLTRPLETG